MRYIIYNLIGLVLLINNVVLADNNSGAAFSTWPDTGQTKCYTNTQELLCPSEGQSFYGQDGQYNGPAPSYTLLGGGTMVKDNVTGLIWEIKNNMDENQDYSNPNDADNTYTWCDTNTDTNGGYVGTCDSTDTADFIDMLNSGSGFGGYTNWRLPTIKELATLVDLGRIPNSPAISPIFKATTKPSTYFSSTTRTDVPSAAWDIYFDGGFVGYSNKSSAYYVRAVRGEQNPPEKRFVDDGDTVTDTFTCLQWQKTTMDTKNGFGPDDYTWQEALALCEELNLAGHTDWRLPDRNELGSLVDYSRSDPAIDPVFVATLPPLNSSWYSTREYWSSTTFSEAYMRQFAWGVDFNKGSSGATNKSLWNLVRAVRGKQCGGLGIFGDINKDGLVDLSDTILALQIVTGIVPADTITTDNDVNGDVKVGLEEALYALKKVANAAD